MTPPTLLTEWARLLLGSLRVAGLRDVVVSPGSRSTPFAWAALQDPGLRCRTLIDERSAAFYAVGLARMTGEPALLICTSGSAAANYFPALVEAAESGLPVLVLTADRPLELQAAAAPQTIDQVKLYGDYARAYFELGTPDAHPAMLRAVPRLAAQALLAARSPSPGPVHLNARARKPLEPRHGTGPAEEELRAVVDRLLGGVPRAFSSEAEPSAGAIAAVADACRNARRGLIVCGPAAPADAVEPESLAALVRATGFPVVAEAASQLRLSRSDGAADPGQSLDAFVSLLEIPGFAEAHAPDLLIQVGRPPTASAWHSALERWPDADRYVLSPRDWSDPSSTAAALVLGPLDRTVRALTTALVEADVDVAAGDETSEATGDRAGATTGGSTGAGTDRDAWAAELGAADERARARIEESLAGGFSEGAAVRAVVDRLPAGSVLALGNSLPIREVDVFVPGGPRGLTVWFQRGANGIDGLISGAAGAAAASGRPTTLLIGDVSFVHDIGGLQAARGLPAPLTVVVLNNGGGRIFERLPLAAQRGDDPAMASWLTPPGVDFRAAALAFGLPFACASDGDQLAAALDRLAESGGVLEVVVPDGGTTAHQQELRRRLEAELGG